MPRGLFGAPASVRKPEEPAASFPHWGSRPGLGAVLFVQTALPRKRENEVNPIVLFDGVCNLCNGVVRFILARDAADRFRFASLQSDAARRLLGDGGPAETIVLVEEGKRYTKSSAALRIARGLRFPWPLWYALVAVPRPLRDLIYDWVAGHRYAWFGKLESCPIPAPEVRGRFLD